MIERLRALLSRVVVDRSGPRPQLSWLAKRLAPDCEVFQPQGLHFQAPGGAQGVGAALGGDPSALVALGLGADVPPGDIADGEGGLHYLGAWRVFLDASGNVHLGEKDGSNAPSVAADVDQLFKDLATAINGWTPVAMDGGAALKAALSAWVTAATSADTGSDKVKIP